ncbi:MAG: asparagine synthetase B family protein [bacterium]
MKGIFTEHKLTSENLLTHGYKEVSPSFWIQQDRFSCRHEYIEGRDARIYSVFIRGESSQDLVERIKAYISGETDALVSLKGRWLIVIYEESPSLTNPPQITMISDRIGSHRVYYSYDGSSFEWSTNFNELIESKKKHSQESKLDVSALNGYLCFLHQPSYKTLVQGIFFLPPASCLVLSEGSLKIDGYWSPEFDPQIESEEKAVSEIKYLIDECITPQIQSSDKKTGLFLSGGIDSSLLCSISAQEGIPPVTFTAGFDGIDDERPAAKAVSAHFKTRHKEIIIRPEDVPDLLWDVTRCLEFPVGNPSSLATFAVAREAKNEVDRLLSGIGSDEVFAGHIKHILARYWFISRKAVSLMRAPFFPFGGIDKGSVVGRPKVISRYIDLYTYIAHDQLNRLLLPGYVSTENYFYSDLYRDAFHEEQFLTDLFIWLCDDLVSMTTTLAAHHDIWLDLPLCSDDIIECAARIPLTMKIKGKTGKVVLRKAVKGLVPEWVLKKKRQGFTLPMGHWFRGPLKGLLDSYLDRKSIEKRGIFDPEMIRRIIEAHLSGKQDLSLQLWGLITLEVWQRIFIDSEN